MHLSVGFPALLEQPAFLIFCRSAEVSGAESQVLGCSSQHRCDGGNECEIHKGSGGREIPWPVTQRSPRTSVAPQLPVHGIKGAFVLSSLERLPSKRLFLEVTAHFDGVTEDEFRIVLWTRQECSVDKKESSEKRRRQRKPGHCKEIVRATLLLAER